MSNVTNVMIQFYGVDGDAYAHKEFGTDYPNLAKIQTLIKELGDGAELRHIAAHGEGEEQKESLWGGGKYPQTHVLAGAFNYLQLEEFIAVLEKLEWSEPRLFRLFTQGEDSEAFGVWIIRDGKIVCVVEEEQL